jgi:signal transduction histidine kinase
MSYNRSRCRVQFLMLSIAYDITVSSPVHQQVSKVVSTLVHDLRQPLSVIEACADYLDLVLPMADRRTRQQLELLQQQVGDANRMMHDVLMQLHYAVAPSGVD